MADNNQQNNPLNDAVENIETDDTSSSSEQQSQSNQQNTVTSTVASGGNTIIAEQKTRTQRGRATVVGLR
ncbi:hypothetical protein L0B53_18450 (plasmid) [Vibrio sp. SS-MA-C1-2]|uniref:hypothetical protein n=1 Tax=Vibrio sp. SS-MA-C1-2 TaxID=2908646 RepID=UPI001F1E5303|nr:hypothetical protein [Vibrio sp. SS-MA-C1-2]UJF20308.1 hypothetical protein L0B53_18450 [Vibrio sp. SS-MA-C1-2]